jgi:hypothetical protein
MKDSSRGFSNQQALLILLICFPIGLIGLGLVVIMLQRQTPQVSQSQQSPVQIPSPGNDSTNSPGNGTANSSGNSTTIEPLPSFQPSVTQETGISELEARTIVERWLTVKSQIFAPPFDRDLADQVVAAGPLWNDITKPDGSISWLKNNDSYYSYSAIKVNRVISFAPSSSMPSIVVSVTEDSILHSPKGSKASDVTANWIYTLKEEGETWKIWDYKRQ